MMKRNLFFILIAVLLGGFLSTAFAASTFRQVNVNPFYQPPLTSEADLKGLVKDRAALIKAGFAKAGHRDLYRAFSEQFPSAKIDTVKVSPGETFKWMFFRKKGDGPVIVTKNVTWKGSTSLEAYRFYIDRKGLRYEFAVLAACGNFALKDMTKAPSAKGPAGSGKPAAAAPSRAPSVLDKREAGAPGMAAAGARTPSASEKAAGAVPAPAAGIPDRAAAGTGARTPSASEKAAGAVPAPAAGIPDRAAAGTGATTPSASEKAAGAVPAPAAGIPDRAAAGTGARTPSASEKAAASVPASPAAGTAALMTTTTARFPGGPVVDAGFSYQFDPASYLFARVGYEIPLYDKLSLIAFVGGSFRIYGKDGGTAFIADAILDYHWWNRLSFGLGAGYWSGNGGQMDLIANLGFLLYGKPESFNSTLFLEGRSAVDELGRLHDQGRWGVGIRFRF